MGSIYSSHMLKRFSIQVKLPLGTPLMSFNMDYVFGCASLSHVVCDEIKFDFNCDVNSFSQHT